MGKEKANTIKNTPQFEKMSGCVLHGDISASRAESAWLGKEVGEDDFYLLPVTLTEIPIRLSRAVYSSSVFRGAG